MTAKVAVAVPSSGVTSTTWASKLAALLAQETTNGVQITHVTAVSSAVPDHNKNNSVYKRAAEQKDRWGKTDTNRNALVGPTIGGQELTPNSFFDSDAEWVFWIDDDTVPPPLVITKLLNLGREFVAGVYFNPKWPHNPIAYVQREDGLYHAFYNYPKGTLVQVDSVGMGCTLIHRNVYERMIEAYDLWVLPTGTVFPMLKTAVKDDKETPPGQKSYVEGGYMHIPVRRPEEDNNQPWPFYVLEYGRTEDHYFCEKAAAVGAKPYLDTSIECEHLKVQAVHGGHYSRAAHERLQAEYERLAEIESAGRGGGEPEQAG